MHPSKREKILAEWRGLSQSRPKPDRVVQIGPALEAIFKQIGLAERFDESEMTAAWQSIVGEFLAAHSAPIGLKDGCLLVRVSQPTVRYELDRVWKKKILASMKERFGPKKINSIRFQH